MDRKAKTGGRQKGTPNKVSQDLRLLFKDIILKEIECIHKTLQNAEPEVRLNFILKSLPYVMPRYRDVEFPESEMKQESTWLKDITATLLKKNDEAVEAGN